MDVHYVHAWCQWRAERGTEFHGTTGNCGLPHGCLELNLCSLQKQQVHLRVESPLHILTQVAFTLFPKKVFICLFVCILGVYVIHSNQLYCGCNPNNGSTFRRVKSYTLRMAPQAISFPLAAPADFLLCKTLLLHIGYCQNIYTRQ